MRPKKPCPTLMLGCLLLAVLIAATSANAQRAASAVPTVINGFVVSITVTDGGSGYTAAPSVAISGGNGTGATAIATILNGAVSQVIVGNAGSGYAGAPVVSIAAPPSADPPFSDGLVAHFTMNDSHNDVIGGLVGSTSSSPVYKAGVIGDASFFDGPSSVLSIEDPIEDGVDFSATEDFTLSCWMRTTALPPTNTYPRLISKEEYSLGRTGYNLAVQPFPEGWVSFDINDSDRQVSVLSRLNICNGIWHQVVGMRRQGRLLLFVDGNLADSADSAPSPFDLRNNGKLMIGGHQYTAEYFFSGLIDELRIYSRALSDQEVMDLYHLEALEQPWVGIEVETVRVTMHLKPTKKYQLESSFDLKTWGKVGEPILAGSSEIPLTLNTLAVGQYFRVYEVQ